MWVFTAIGIALTVLMAGVFTLGLIWYVKSKKLL